MFQSNLFARVVWKRKKEKDISSPLPSSRPMPTMLSYGASTQKQTDALRLPISQKRWFHPNIDPNKYSCYFSLSGCCHPCQLAHPATAEGFFFFFFFFCFNSTFPYIYCNMPQCEKERWRESLYKLCHSTLG